MGNNLQIIKYIWPIQYNPWHTVNLQGIYKHQFLMTVYSSLMKTKLQAKPRQHNHADLLSNVSTSIYLIHWCQNAMIIQDWFLPLIKQSMFKDEGNNNKKLILTSSPRCPWPDVCRHSFLPIIMDDPISDIRFIIFITRDSLPGITW